jgi:hypothetical protein
VEETALDCVRLLFPEGMKAQVMKLTIERQMYLLAVGTKAQARFKREGVLTFAQKQAQKEKPWGGDGYMKSLQKKHEQRIHQGVVNGQAIIYEERDE